ncbi:MAG: hypothetical protein AVDCRST_MAG05-4901, partial [uncultured Rubrobacteraceae bacterium]
ERRGPEPRPARRPRGRRGLQHPGPRTLRPRIQGGPARARGSGRAGREPGGLDQGLAQHKELQGRQRLHHLAVQDHDEHLPERPAEGGAPRRAPVRRRDALPGRAPRRRRRPRGRDPQRRAPRRDRGGARARKGRAPGGPRPAPHGGPLLRRDRRDPRRPGRDGQGLGQPGTRGHARGALKGERPQRNRRVRAV